jgi:hypothetical protein
MDDLISRSALLEEIESLHVTVTGLRTGKGILRRFAKQYKESVLRIISEQPTAYNVNKVMEKINEQPYKQIDVFVMPQPFISRHSVENIVKAGGVNG